jgi:hypothetical protein
MNFIDLPYKLKKIGRRMGRPDILFWTLAYLMILIFVGTIAQKWMGLYEAQKLFFSSFIPIWHGVPFLGGYAILAIMSVNLTCKFLFLSPWTRAKIGIHIIHLSIIILLIGGMVTATTMREGFIALKQGESGQSIEDYHKRVLTFVKGDDAIEVDFYDIKKADLSRLPFDITIIQKCKNSAIRPRVDLGAPDNDGVGAAAMAELSCIQPFTENERNIASLTYKISNASDNENGTYIVFEGRQTNDEIAGYTVSLDRQERALLFTVALQSFQRDVYPGTNMPRDYESRVIIRDGDVTWPAIISMNEPLRYSGYTFYQASTLIDLDGEAVSVLSIVENKGMVFPYISGLLLAFGLIWHIILRVRGRA